MKKIVMMLVMFALTPFASTAMALETELIGGGGIWWNNLAKGDFLFGEGVLWQEGDQKAYPLGFGAYGSLESGESKISPYTWDGYVIGPEVGASHTWATPPDGFLRQWQIKLRAVWESLEGRNAESEYHMTQNDIKAGLYGEYLSQLSRKTQLIFIAEGWKMLYATKKSTVVGERAENRDQASAGIFGQYKFSNPLSIRAGASLFWQGWDEMTGVRGQGEVRLYEHFMVGAYIAVPFAVPEIDKQFNAEVSDLVTTGIYGRVEF